MRKTELVLLAWLVGGCTVTSTDVDGGTDGGDATADVAVDASPGDASDAACFPEYTHAGCDAASTMLCGPQDACAGNFCGCNGQTFVGGCGFADKPFDHFGACVDAGAD